MATRISEIYDALVSYIDTTYTDRGRLNDVIDIGANPDLVLRSGIGLRFDPASPTDRSILGSVSFSRNVVLILTNIVEGIDTDSTKRDNAIKDMFEDQYTFFTALQQNSILPETTNFSGDSGIVEVPLDRRSFLMLETTFTFEYFEDCS